jgi:hypothetical protein
LTVEDRSKPANIVDISLTVVISYPIQLVAISTGGVGQNRGEIRTQQDRNLQKMVDEYTIFR